MTPYFLGQILGALLLTLLTSRLGLWLTRTWAGGRRRIVVVHAISLAILMIAVVARRAAEGFHWTAGLSLILPQAIWLGVDLVRDRRRRDALKPASAPRRPR